MIFVVVVVIITTIAIIISIIFFTGWPIGRLPLSDPGGFGLVRLEHPHACRCWKTAQVLSYGLARRHRCHCHHQGPRNCHHRHSLSQVSITRNILGLWRGIASIPKKSSHHHHHPPNHQEDHHDHHHRHPPDHHNSRRVMLLTCSLGLSVTLAIMGLCYQVHIQSTIYCGYIHI